MFHHNEPATLCNYLWHLYTPTCYIPTCLTMHCFGQTDLHHLPFSTQQYTPLMPNQHKSHSAHENTCAHQHPKYHSLLSITKPVPYLLIDGIPLAHLDCPPDQLWAFCNAPNGHPLSDATISQPEIRSTWPVLYQHGLVFHHNPANLCPLTPTLSDDHPAHYQYQPAVTLATPHSVTHFVGKHDLQPP